MVVCLLSVCLLPVLHGQEPKTELVFPLNPEHNHAPGIVECPNGDLLASWYRGSGERKADDVVVLGARLKKGIPNGARNSCWQTLLTSPDCNTCMMIDAKQRLRLFWPIIIANSWESCLTQVATSSEYQKEGAPKWDRQETIWLKPAEFSDELQTKLAAFVRETGIKIPAESSEGTRRDSIACPKIDFTSDWVGNRVQAHRPSVGPDPTATLFGHLFHLPDGDQR